MPELPPAELVATLERLGLASGEQVARMGRRVGRLARELPRFDSVWIDALAQDGVLTPFQAAELNAGRGQSAAASGRSCSASGSLIRAMSRAIGQRTSIPAK